MAGKAASTLSLCTVNAHVFIWKPCGASNDLFADMDCADVRSMLTQASTAAAIAVVTDAWRITAPQASIISAECGLNAGRTQAQWHKNTRAGAGKVAHRQRQA
jgi:hypothetical protein